MDNIILFTEYCKRDGKPWMSCFGLLFGRLGDALGTGLCICLKPFYIAHVVSAAILFALAVMVLFALYRQLYEQTSSQPAAQADPSIDSFDRFAESSDISKRERDVLRLLLEKHSNTEISETLSISENTVKTHVRNILQKTDCKNRVELIEKFQATVNAPK